MGRKYLSWASHNHTGKSKNIYIFENFDLVQLWKTLDIRYSDLIVGKLDCNDKMLISGTLTVLSNSRSMTNYLYANKIKIFDFAKFAEQFKNQIRENAEKNCKR